MKKQLRNAMRGKMGSLSDKLVKKGEGWGLEPWSIQAWEGETDLGVVMVGRERINN